MKIGWFSSKMQRRRPGLWVPLWIVLTAGLIIMAQAYTGAAIKGDAAALIVPDVESSQAALSVVTFDPEIPGAGMSLLAFGVADEGIDGGFELCGTITNNTGSTLWDLAAVSRDGAWGRLDVSQTRVPAGESAQLLCDLGGLDPGAYRWEGEVLAEWSQGRARVPLQVEFEVPEPPPVPEDDPESDPDNPDNPDNDPENEDIEEDDAEDSEG